VILALAALAVTLLQPRADQALAGLVAVTVLAFWLVYFFVLDHVQQESGIPQSTRRTEIVCVLVVVGACAVASAGSLRAGRPATAQEARR
jgi:lipopolysaccharide export LptBFGC system permease protein LptF